ncbi:LysR substrate-binding domain-containing protein [Paraburkholderia sp. JHI2823]|uniref:LysR family transcriptional regulator n=1 Tax=Paraburkholderia TaxID=1822464 RepID=UPI0003FA43A0|nr:LysR family transcriptional regulator [Paraburkholderia mimosarum]
MPINLTLHQLDAFRAVARYRSFSGAAKALFISQPSLTLLIRNLEGALSVRLFDRTTRRVELTTAGEEFLPVAERIFSELEIAQENLADRSALRRGRVALGALPSASADWIPRSIFAFHEAHPEISVEVKDGVAGQLIDMVRAGEIDFALGSYTTVEPDIQFSSIAQDEIYLVCRSDHRLAHRRRVKWAEILKEPFIAMSQGTSVRYATDSAFASLQVVKPPAYDVSLLSTMFGLARSGVGVTALPTTVLEVFNVDGVAKIPLVEPVMRRDIGFVTRRGREPTPSAKQLMNTIEQCIVPQA